jgi:O-antigen/teichoic acid export membrane protein
VTAKIIAKNSMWALASHLLSRGSLLVAAIIIARGFELPSYAAFSYFQMTSAMIAAFGSVGLGIATSRNFAEMGRKSRREKAPIIGATWLLSVSFAFVSMITVLLLPDMITTAGLGIPRWLMAFGVFVLVLQVIPAGAVIGLELFRSAAIVATGAAVFTIAGAIFAVVIGSVEIAMGVVIFAALYQFIGLSLLIVKEFGWIFVLAGLKTDSASLMKVVNVSGPMFVVSIMSGSGSWLVGRIILDGPVGTYGFAIFAIGLQWFALALVLPGVISRVLLPRLVRMASIRVDSKELVRDALIMTLGSALVVAVIGALFGPWLIGLYGVTYEHESSLVIVYLGAAVMTAPATALGNALLANDYQWFWLGLTAVWFIVLILAAFLLRSHMAWGGAAAFASAYLVLSIGAFIKARRSAIV